jgi:hypothetical protein
VAAALCGGGAVVRRREGEGRRVERRCYCPFIGWRGKSAAEAVARAHSGDH